MLCDKCKKNNASYFSRTTINGVTHEEHLCLDCAKKLNKSMDFGDFDIFDDCFKLPKLFENDFGNTMLLSPFEDDFFDYKPDNTSLIGDALNSINVGAKKFESERGKINPKVIELQNKIKVAVENEDYETAAKLKKEIEAINIKSDENLNNSKNAKESQKSRKKDEESDKNK